MLASINHRRWRLHANNYSGGTPALAVVAASDILALGPAAWYRWNTGQTVAQWNDQSGNARHAVQAVGTNQPTLAGGIYTFDGIDNFFKAVGFTLSQPESIFMLAKIKTWTGNDTAFDGNASATGMLSQQVATPQLTIRAGGSNTANNSDAALGSWVVIRVAFNGASSELQIGNNAATTGNPGAFNMDGLTVAARGDGAAGYMDCDVAEVLAFPSFISGNNQTNVKTWIAQQRVLAGV